MRSVETGGAGSRSISQSTQDTSTNFCRAAQRLSAAPGCCRLAGDIGERCLDDLDVVEDDPRDHDWRGGAGGLVSGRDRTGVKTALWSLPARVSLSLYTFQISRR